MTFLTDADLAEQIGKSRGFVQNQCRDKLWPHLRVGKSYRFTPEQVTAIAALLEVAPAAKAPEAAAADSWGHKGRRGHAS